MERKTLRQLRDAHGWTQFQLAAEAHVSLSSVVNIEASRQEPRVALAQKLASALGVTVDQIAWPTPAPMRRSKRAA